MKYLFAICVAMNLLLYNCNGDKLPDKNIESVVIFAVTTEGQERVASVDNKSLVAEIVKSINHRRSEPVKFRPAYALEIKYKGVVKRVLVRGRHINISGLTYTTEEDLGAKIKLIVDEAKR